MRHSLAVFLLFTLVACSSDPTKDEMANLSADEIYTKAQAQMEDHNYEKAVKARSRPPLFAHPAPSPSGATKMALLFDFRWSP